MPTRHLRKYALPFIAVFVSPAPQAQGPDPKARIAAQMAAMNAETVKQLRKALAESAKASIFALKKKNCSLKVDCNLTVNVVELYDATQKLSFCAVQTDNIDIEAGANPKKNDETPINWTLAAPASIATYYFADLVTFDDLDKAADKGTLKISGDKLTMSVKHKYKKKNYTLGYFPVVFQTIGGGDPAMCAAIDPKIGNN